MQGKNMKYWVWLSSLPRVRTKKLIQLIEMFGEPKTIWELTRAELKDIPFITEAVIEQILSSKFRSEAEYHVENIHKNNIKVVTLFDENYPYNLKNIHDPPVVLYMNGNITGKEKAIAVVGSRKASFYGIDMAEAISCELAKCGVTVISGMARGVDTHAHIGCLKAGGNTIAVLGCGPDVVYPVENKKLMENICRHGAAVSEYLPGTPPISYNFPARNRIISGISLGVVVIEASEKSGSLITADFALEQGREVFAVPGNVNSSNSKGANMLIKDGAKMVTCIEDILEELNLIIDRTDCCKGSRNKSLKYKGLDKDEYKVVEFLESEPLHIDMLAQKSGLSVQMVSSLLLNLELMGIIEQIPGKVYKLKN